jgi:hypothetical protein
MATRVVNEARASHMPGNAPNPKPAPWRQSRELRAFLGFYYETLEDMAIGCYFTEKYGDECPDRHPIHWSITKIQKSIAIHGLGLSWPLTPTDLDSLDEDTSIRYVEFFHRAVSKPTDGWDHPYCEGWHPIAYDKSLGQVEYQQRVNEAFTQSGMSLQLDGGRVLKSINMQQLALPKFVECEDDFYLNQRVEAARRKFVYGDELERMEALTMLANMLERLKERLGDGDKRLAVPSIVAGFRMDYGLTSLLDDLFRSTGRFSNETTIRHHEDSRVSLPDQWELITLLFHNYYNLIALCIARLRITDKVLAIGHENPRA